MIRDILGKELIICDGAFGTMLQVKGLDGGRFPALLSFTSAKEIEGIYREYFEAGSDFVATNTFSANRLHLKDSGHSVREVVTQAVEIAGNAGEKVACRHGRGWVALDVAPTGQMLEPYGDLEEDEAYDLFAEMIDAGASAGADLIILETFADLNEISIAAKAAKDCCKLPIFASCTFETSGRTFMGVDPKSIVDALTELGVDAVGLNCSMGPQQMLPVAEKFLECSSLPVLAQPNAGLPVSRDGKMVYDVTVEEFMTYMEKMLDAGISVAGSCCGTTPDFIRAIRESAEKRNYKIAK